MDDLMTNRTVLPVLPILLLLLVSAGGADGSETTRAGARSVREGWKSNASWPSRSDTIPRSTA